MTLTPLIQSALMGIVEGLTEFLPISSTGHLILTANLTDNLLGLKTAPETMQVFTIAVQIGAILALCLYYWQRLWATFKDLPKQDNSGKIAQRFAINVIIGCLPAIILGLLFNKTIKAHLFNANTVASTFIIGGFIILWAEHRYQKQLNQLSTPDAITSNPPLTVVVSLNERTLNDLTVLQALKVGLAQCCALIPGTSRSGATIIGGMLLGLNRSVATQFSFFLAIPMLLGAAGYDLYKHRDILSMNDASFFIVGIVAAFISALLVIRWLLHYIASHSFIVFAYYRIAFGIMIFLTAYYDLIHWKQ